MASSTFTEAVKKSGHYVGGNALAPRVRRRRFACDRARSRRPTGRSRKRRNNWRYYLLQARDLDEAIQLAARIRGARFGSVEVRPVMEMPA